MPRKQKASEASDLFEKKISLSIFRKNAEAQRVVTLFREAHLGLQLGIVGTLEQRQDWTRCGTSSMAGLGTCLWIYWSVLPKDRDLRRRAPGTPACAQLHTRRCFVPVRMNWMDLLGVQGQEVWLPVTVTAEPSPQILAKVAFIEWLCDMQDGDTKGASGPRDPNGRL